MPRRACERNVTRRSRPPQRPGTHPFFTWVNRERLTDAMMNCAPPANSAHRKNPRHSTMQRQRHATHTMLQQCHAGTPAQTRQTEDATAGVIMSTGDVT